MWNFLHDGLTVLLSTASWLFAQVGPDPNGQPIALSGFWLGIYAVMASLAAAFGTLAKLFFDDREKRRASDIVKLRLTLGNDRARRYTVEDREYLERLVEHVARIPGCPPGIPEPPGPPNSHVHLEPDDDD